MDELKQKAEMLMLALSDNIECGERADAIECAEALVVITKAMNELD